MLDDCTNPNVTDFYDVSSCSSYYICDLQREPVKASCHNPDIYYAGPILGCTKYDTLCCSSTLCHPYCHAEDIGTEVPDPCDCTGFYFCVVGYENLRPDPQFHSYCGHGEIFDPDLRACVTEGSTGKTCQDVLTCPDTRYCDITPSTSKYMNNY